jgi:hypothetical protein
MQFLSLSLDAGISAPASDSWDNDVKTDGQGLVETSGRNLIMYVNFTQHI